MPCFKHGDDKGIFRGPNIEVYLKVKPGPNKDDPVDIYLWEPKCCGHTVKATKGPKFTHMATLTVKKGFLCEKVCRGQNEGAEALYGALTTVANLKKIQPAPAGSDVDLHIRR